MDAEALCWGGSEGVRQYANFGRRLLRERMWCSDQAASCEAVCDRAVCLPLGVICTQLPHTHSSSSTV